MAQLNTRKTYTAGEPLLKQDLDTFIDDIETFINVTKLNDDNIQDAGITASTKIIDNTMAGEKFVNGAFTTAKITDANVTTAKIETQAVTTAKIADLNITTAKIADANVTLTHFADGAVTFDKMAEGYNTVGPVSDTRPDTQASTVFTKILDIYLTTTAGDTYVIFEGISGYFICSDSNTGVASDAIGFNMALTRTPAPGTTSTVLASTQFSGIARRGAAGVAYAASFPASEIKFIVPAPGAGAFMYSLYITPSSLNGVTTSDLVVGLRKVSK